MHTGSIPPQLGQLSTLTKLSLAGNELSGEESIVGIGLTCFFTSSGGNACYLGVISPVWSRFVPLPAVRKKCSYACALKTGSLSAFTCACVCVRVCFVLRFADFSQSSVLFSVFPHGLIPTGTAAASHAPARTIGLMVMSTIMLQASFLRNSVGSKLWNGCIWARTTSLVRNSC